MSPIHRTLRALPLALLGVLAASPPAGALEITREFSSAWADPARPGHGFVTDVVDPGDGSKLVVVYWFTYDTQGRQIWVVGTGPVDGNQATLRAVTTRGGSFDNTFDPAAVQQQPWGTLKLSFASCDSGALEFLPADPAAPRGRIDVTRLTARYNAQCSGGISDDRSAGAGETEIVRFMQAATVAPGARGKTEFAQRADRTDFKVEVEDVPAGTYALRVGEQIRGSFAVIALAGGTRGGLEFRSPVEPGKLLLDFDPRDQRIAVERDGVVYLSTDLVAPPPPGPPGGGAPLGSGLWVLQVEPSGNDGPELDAELSLRSDRAEFSVELEDVPAGDYALRVAGQPRGTISVVAVPGGTSGELEFRNPAEPGKTLLDFDPRGQLIQAERNGQVVLSGLFPIQPSAGIGDDDGGGGGGGGGGGSTGGTLLTAPLERVGPDGDASGSLEWQATADETEFEVEVEDLDDGSYTVVVDNVARGSMRVDGGEGELKFNDPPRAGRGLLDFDPRGKLTEVVRNGVVYLRGRLP